MKKLESARQADKDVLHVVIGINGSQKALHLFQLLCREIRWIDRVLGLVAQLGRQHGEALGWQCTADQIQIRGIRPEHGDALFVTGFKVLGSRFNRCKLGVGVRTSGLSFNHAHMVEIPRHGTRGTQLPFAKQHPHFRRGAVHVVGQALHHDGGTGRAVPFVHDGLELLTVTAAVQVRGGEGQARSRNLTDFTGPVPVLLDEVMAWVRQNLGTEHVYRPDGQLERRPELPLAAVRELLGNALVHRDLGPDTLGAGKAIQMRLTDRALFIQSPGGRRGVSLTQLESDEHAQAAVNQRLYQIAKKLTTPDGASVIEGEGGGIHEVFRSARQWVLDRPQLIDTGVQFKALLWRPRPEGARPSRREPAVEVATTSPAEVTPGAKAGTPSSAVPPSSAPTRHEGRVLGALAAGEAVGIRDLEEATMLTARQIRYALRQPLLDGLVEMTGGQGHKDTRYRLVSARGAGD